MRFFDLFATALACSSVAATASNLDGANAVPAIAEGYLYARQDNTDNSNNSNNDSNNSNGSSNDNNSNSGSNSDSNNGSTPSQTSDQNSDAPDSTITTPPKSSGDNSSDNNSSGDNKSATDNKSGGDNKSNSGVSATKGSSSKTSLVAIDPQDPAGGLSMITPAATAASQYYKVGQTITWVWNYTSLLRPPKHIDILASFASMSNAPVPTPFTLAVNQSYDATQTFEWDTGKYTSETGPLPIGTYTLVVYDADASGGVSHTPSPGYLGVWQQFRFGMYTPQAPTDMANPYICTTCNAAASLERLTIGALFAMAGLTVSSFMWFTGAWHVN